MFDIRNSFSRKILLRPLTIGSGGSGIDYHFFVSHYHLQIQNKLGLACRVNMLTHHGIATYCAGGHQCHLATRAQTCNFRFVTAFLTDIPYILHQTTPPILFCSEILYPCREVVKNSSQESRSQRTMLVSLNDWGQTRNLLCYNSSTGTQLIHKVVGERELLSCNATARLRF